MFAFKFVPLTASASNLRHISFIIWHAQPPASRLHGCIDFIRHVFHTHQNREAVILGLVNSSFEF